MSTIRTLCQGIIEHLADNDYRVSDHLGLGLSEAEIERALAGFPFVLPKSLVEMYKWSGGVARIRGKPVPACLYPWWRFDTLTWSLEHYKVLSEPIEDLPDIWAVDWFPFLGSTDISAIGIRCDDRPTDDGEIFVYDHTLGSAREFLGLETMLETLLMAYRKGIIFVRKGQLVYDSDAFAKIAKQLNPGLERWVI